MTDSLSEVATQFWAILFRIDAIETRFVLSSSGKLKLGNSWRLMINPSDSSCTVSSLKEIKDRIFSIEDEVSNFVILSTLSHLVTSAFLYN